MKKLYYMLLLAVISITVVSCNGWDSPYYVDSIVGSWESYYGCQGNYEYDIFGQDRVRYDFYANNTGRYTYYSYYGLSYVDFDWETYGDRLVIRYYDGDSDYLFYGYDRNGDLLLALDSRFYQYTAYRPSGYWAPAKDASTVTVKGDMDKSMDNKGVSRAVKSKDELSASEAKEK